MAGPSESLVTSSDFARAAAPLLFGPMVNWTLYGVLCVQIYVYSYNFPIDGRTIKFLAYFVFVFETAQTALTGADIYYWFITGFGDVEHLANSHFTPIDVAIMTAVISLIVQGFFCYRIWVLDKRSLWICCVIAVSAVTQAVAATWLGIESLKVGEYVTSKTGLYLWSIPSAIADILIAVAMTMLLRRASTRANDNFSSFVLIRVVRLTIETNALTATLAVTALVLYAAFPNEVYYVYITVVIGKIYSNTLLASLNNRIYFRDHQLSRHGNSSYLSVAKRVRATTMTFASSTVPEPPPQASKDDIFPLYSVSQPGKQDHNRGDNFDTDWSLPHPRKCHLLPEDPEWTAGMSPHPYGR